MKRSESIGAYAKALSAFQEEVTNPKMTAVNPHVNSKYAPLSEVFNTVRPIMAKHGLSFQQDVDVQEERVVVTTLFLHESGEWMESSPLPVPAGQKLKDGTIKINAQTIGAAITYGKRYQFQAMAGVSADEDHDANEVSQDDNQPIHVPKNLVSSPSEATLKAKWQLVKGTIDGFEDYVKGLRDKGHDDRYIAAALDKAKNQKEQKPA